MRKDIVIVIVGIFTLTALLCGCATTVEDDELENVFESDTLSFCYLVDISLNCGDFCVATFGQLGKRTEDLEKTSSPSADKMILPRSTRVAVFTKKGLSLCKII